MILRTRLPGIISIDYDPRAHAAYIHISDLKVAKTRPEAENVLVDLDSKGNLVGVEMLNVGKMKINAQYTLRKIANEFSVPVLKQIRPEYINKLYAHA